MVPKAKHPKGLMVLFFTEMWERFSYYGMRALLVLYLTAELINGGFGLERVDALKIYAIFTGLVYVTPIIGGFFADRYIGQRKAVFIGAILMAIGHFFMARSQLGDLHVREFFRNNGLGLIIMGTGFLKANISTIVGALYSEKDNRKDSGFTLFYMGINVGALAGPLIVGFLGENINWFWGFIAAGLGMILSTLWFYLQGEKLEYAGMPPNSEIKEDIPYYKLNSKDFIDIIIYVIVNVVFIWGVLFLWKNISNSIQNYIVNTLFIVGGGMLAYIIIKNTKGSTAWSKMGVLLALAFFNILFWSGYEQAGGTFNLFAKEDTARMIGNFEVPAAWFQSVPALFVVMFATPFAALWIWLFAIKKNPRTPAKFGFGLILMSIGFIIISQGAKHASAGVLVSPFWLLGTFLFHTLGEMCLSPIGLSIVTKLSPKNIVSIMMGVWFGSIGLANYLAGVLEDILHNHLPNMHLYDFLTLSTLSGGIIALLLSPILIKMMKGEH